MIPIEKTRQAWRCAAVFSAAKEDVYPGHTEAHGFDLHVGQDVLEYGCGGGSDAMSWLRRENRVTYADVVPFNIQAAGERITAADLRGRATPLLLADSAPIPLSDASFDVVSSHGVLHHIFDPVPVVREFSRILRRGGACYVMLYTEHLRARLDMQVTQLVTWKGLSEAEAFCWLTDEPGCPYAVAYTEEQGRKLLESAGLRLVDTRVYNNNDFRTFRAIKET